MGNRVKNNLSARLTRRKFLKAMGAALITLTSAPGCEPEKRTTPPPPANGGASNAPESVRSFRSRPDLSPPAVEVVTQAHEEHTAPGYIFVAPKKGAGQDGPLILDNSGQPVWFHPVRGEGVRAMDFKVQHYRGEPVLTYYQGVGLTYGRGEYVILDSSYREITRVRAGNGYLGDHHEFLITPHHTALITIYNPLPWDLSAVGGATEGVVLDGIAQEVDIQSGEVLFEWHSLDHVGLEESHYEPPENPKWPFDYFHINSIDVDHDSNLLISARRTFTVYKIDRESGEVIWRLGGKKSDFEMDPGTRTRFQHDARRQPDGTITIFDNGVSKVDERSRGLVLELDEKTMSAALVREYAHPDGRVAATQGNVQVLPNKNVFIGWGSDPLFSEFTRDGQLLFNARFNHASNESYRAFRFEWSAQPTEEEPAVAAEAGAEEDEVRLYASWNGATEVASWEVLAGSGAEGLEPVGRVERDGFETAMRVSTKEAYVGVRARDRTGRVLGTSKAIKPGN